MTELNKYYTPNIDDLYIGYKCEIESNKIWYPEIIKGVSTKENIAECDGFDYYINKDLSNIRTPYLSLEDIENEGYGLYNTSENGLALYFTKWGINVWIHTKLKRMEIFKDEEKSPQIIYKGSYKSINEFRKLCKMLEI